MTARTYSLVEAADELGLPSGKSGRQGKQRIYRMVKSGRLRAVRIGREFRVPADELARLVGGAA